MSEINTNMYTGNHRHSKTLNNWVNKNPDKATEYYADVDGHWIYLHNGWQAPRTYCGTLREHTVKEMLEQIKMIEQGEYQ